MFSIDSTQAGAGAQPMLRALELIRRDSIQTAESLRSVEQAMRAGGAGRGPGTDTERVVRARQRELEVERQLAADRLRAAREQSRADAERLRAREAAERAAVRAAAQEAAATDRQIRQGLTLLSTLGGAERAYSQLTTATLRAAASAGQAIDRTRLLGEVQQRVAQAVASGRLGEAFSEAAVRSRDLRLNLQGVNETLLAMSALFPRITAPLLNISDATRRISSVLGASRPPGGGIGAEDAAGRIPPGVVAGATAGLTARGIAIGAGVLGGALTIGGTVVAIKELVEANNQLEVALDEVSAITGITGEQLASLRDRAIEFASESQGAALSAAEIAKAFQLVAQANPQLAGNSEALAEVTRQAILLSQAAGDELGPTVDTITSALSQFGLGAESAARVVDVLAAGAKVGAIEVPQLGEALARTGSVARAAGIEIEDLVALIETAGKSKQPLDIIETSIRNLILRLQTSGNLKAGDSLLGVLREIEAQGLTTGEMVKLFGERTITTAQFILQNLDVFEQYQAGVRESGVAAEQARVRLDNLSSAAARAGSAWRAFIDALSQTAPVEAAGDLLQGLLDRVARVGTVLTAAVQGRGEDLIAELLPEEAIRERIAQLRDLLTRDFLGGATLEGSAAGAILQHQIDTFEAALEQLQARRAFTAGLGAAGPVDDAATRAAAANARALELELDKTAKATAEFLAFQEQIQEALATGNITQERAIELTALARAATIENTKAAKDSAAESRKAANEQAAWNETLRRAAEAQNEAATRSEQRISDIERENGILTRQLEIVGQGELALAALTAELAAQEEIDRRIREVGGPISLEELQRIREAVTANVQLKAALAEAQRVQQAAERDAAQRAERQARLQLEPVLQAARSLQETISGAISDGLRGSIDSVRDFTDVAFRILTDFAGDVATLFLFRPVLEGLEDARTGVGQFGGLLEIFGGGAAPAATSGAGDGTIGFLLGAEGAETVGLLKSIDENAQKTAESTTGIFGRLAAGGAGVAGGLGFVQAFGLQGGLASALLGGAGALGGALLPGGGPIASLVTGLVFSVLGGEIIDGISDVIAGSNPFKGVSQAQRGIRGGLAGFGLQAAGASVGIGTAAATGAALGTVVPGLGTAVGALVGAAIAAFSEGQKTQVQLRTSATDTGFRADISRLSPFGFVGADAARSQGLEGRATTAIAEALVAFDTALAAHIDPGAVDLVAQALQTSPALRESAQSFDREFSSLLVDRAATVLRAALGAEGVSTATIDQIIADTLPKKGSAGRDPAEIVDTVTGLLSELSALTLGRRELRGEEIAQSETEIERLRDLFSQLAPAATRFGVSLAELQADLAAGEARIREDIDRDVQRGIQEIEDPLGALLAREQEIAEARLREVTAAGGNLVEAERLNALQRARAVEQFTKQANAPLQGVLDELSTGELGALSVSERLANAEQRFSEALAVVNAGGAAGIEGRSTLADAARSVLELRREVFASGAGFFQGDFGAEFIRRTLENVLAQPLSPAVGSATSELQQSQLSATERTNTLILELTREVTQLRRDLQRQSDELAQLRHQSLAANG